MHDMAANTYFPYLDQLNEILGIDIGLLLHAASGSELSWLGSADQVVSVIPVIAGCASLYIPTFYSRSQNIKLRPILHPNHNSHLNR